MGKFGAGILPITRHNDEIYIMLARESADISFRDSKKWSDFGGGSIKGETKEECALREGYEETMGMLGSKDELMKKIKKSLIKIQQYKYYSFVIEVEYDEDLPEKFSKIYEQVKNHHPHLIRENNGLYEKDKIKWIRLDDFKENPNKMKDIRPFFKGVIEKLRMIYSI